jgi:hypothetical protein
MFSALGVQSAGRISIKVGIVCPNEKLMVEFNFGSYRTLMKPEPRCVFQTADMLTRHET